MIKTLAATLTLRAQGDSPEAEIVITTPGTDLMHDVIDMDGLDVSAYLGGPRAVGFAHDHSRLPVGRTVSLTKSAAGVRAKFTWLDLPDAKLVRTAFEAGALGASIEFRADEMSRLADGGVHFLKSTLTGWTLTSNPANLACTRMLKSLTTRDADVLALDDEEEVNIADLRYSDVVDELRAGADVLAGMTAADVKAAMAEAIPELATAAMTRQLNKLRGRVD